jgi:hypothetical protein
LKQSKALVTTCIDRKVILPVPGLHYDALGCRIAFTYSSFNFISLCFNISSRKSEKLLNFGLLMTQI